MIAASVGFQCPDDVAAGAKSVRAPRTPVGGRLSANASLVTAVLVVLNVLVYGVQLLRPDLPVQLGTLGLAADGGELIGVAEGEYYRLLTAAFLHVNVLHLLMNMLALASIGPQLEAAFGRWRYLTLYVIAALGGSTLAYLVSDPGQLGVGASGAIFGLFGAFFVVVRRSGGDVSQILVLLGINLFITFSVPNIDWRAHLGGLVVGALLATLFVSVPAGPRRGAVHVAGCVAVVGALVAVVALRTSALQV